jgi:T-complex protein 1 subunit alpha
VSCDTCLIEFWLSIGYSESEITLERVRKILATGANVILTTKGIDDLCLKEFVEAGAMAVRRCRKEDLRRIAKATGATLLSSLANLDGDESFEASSLGSAEEVVQSRISDDELILVKGTKVVSSSSIILRGANGKPTGDHHRPSADPCFRRLHAG